MAIRPRIGVLGVAAALGAGVAGLQAEPEWGMANKEGLATRLVLLAGEAQVGKPLMFRLEARNTGKVTICADIQNLAHPERLLEVRRGGGERVPAISADLIGCQTLQSFAAFPPGVVVELAGGIDAAQEFEIATAGIYRFRHPGVAGELPELGEREVIAGLNGEPLDAKTIFTTLPPSPGVRVEVADGMLTSELELIARLRPILPAKWSVCRRDVGGGVQLWTRSANGVVRIDLHAPPKNAKLEEGHRVLGRSPLGEIRMGVEITPGKIGEDGRPTANLADFWPGAEEAIREALEVEPSEA